MDCQNALLIVGGDEYVSFSPIVDEERFAGAVATGSIDAPGDDVAVGARGQTYWDVCVHSVLVFVVERNEGDVPTAEGDLVVPVVPPVVHSRIWTAQPSVTFAVLDTRSSL